MILRCLSLSIVCVALASCATTGGRAAGPADCSTITAGNTDACVRLNQIQVLGTHNSYHVAPAPPVLAYLGERARNIEYTHRPLLEQLEGGIRKFELDVFADPAGGRYARPAAFRIVNGLDSVGPRLLEPGFKVLHTQDLDYRTTCDTLKGCLTTIRDWSKAHPWHVPIMVMIEAKDTAPKDPDGVGFVKPIPIGATELRALDDEIRSVFDADHVVTPDRVRGRHPTLAAAIRSDGWPVLRAVRGKILFALDNTEQHRTDYLRGNPSLEGRMLFVSSAPDEPAAAFIKMNEALGEDEARIRQRVREGFLIRTRADIPTEEARTGSTIRRDSAFRSGAHYVSTDYPEPSPFGSGYVARLPGAERLAARCNPVNAPEGCRDEWLERASADAIAITNVTVIDVAGGAHQTGVTVLTAGQDIVGLGRDVPVPARAVRVDGTGKFLIPGLWDMHAHHQGTGAGSVDLFVANGVVGTRDMGADVDFILSLRDRINRGELLGPEILATGPILDDRPAHWPFRRRVATANEGRVAVRDLKARGVNFIKVHDGTPREVFFAIAEEAKQAGLPLVGHVPNGVKVEEAIEAGIKSIEHYANYRVLNECSANPPHQQIACDALYGRLVANRVWQTPTMTFFQLIPAMFTGKPLPHAEYASDELLEMTRLNVKESKLDDAALSFFRTNNERTLPATRDLFSRGVGFLAACDGLVPGFCLHDEIEWMTRAGLSPLQALQTATLNPAAFLGRERTQGTVAIGKRADLVLLDGDPSAEIRNTRRIAAVVVRGRLLARTELDRIVASHRRTDLPQTFGGARP